MNFVSVTFSEKPQIIDIFTSSNTDKEEGDRVELKCAASGIPTPVISWTMAGGGVLPTGGRELTVGYCCCITLCILFNSFAGMEQHNACK